MEALLASFCGGLGGFLMGLLITWGNIRAAAVIAAIFAGIGLLAALSSRYPRVERATEALFALWERVVPWLLSVAGPVGLAYWIVRGSLFGWPLWLQAVVLGIWGIALGGMLWIVAWPEARKSSYAWLSDLHAWAPFLYAFNLAAIATVFFAACATIAARTGAVVLRLPGGGDPGMDPGVLHGRLMDFFVWHFLDAIPALKVNDAIQWKVPLDYQGWMLGLLLIGFKLAVIGPTVAAFVLYWRERQKVESAIEAAAARAKVEQD